MSREGNIGVLMGKLLVYFFASCLMTYLLSSVVAVTLTVHNIYLLAKLQELLPKTEKFGVSDSTSTSIGARRGLVAAISAFCKGLLLEIPLFWL